jgi:hypothetical protein
VKRVKEDENGHCIFYTLYEHGTLKSIEVILREGGRRGRIMEGMNQVGYIVHIHGNVTMKPSVQLLYTNKNVKKNKVKYCDTQYA